MKYFNQCWRRVGTPPHTHTHTPHTSHSDICIHTPCAIICRGLITRLSYWRTERSAKRHATSSRNITVGRTIIPAYTLSLDYFLFLFLKIEFGRIVFSHCKGAVYLAARAAVAAEVLHSQSVRVIVAIQSLPNHSVFF